MTQRARVEFAAAGGACNTDFIDNSGGVDCSDHEVNIKILLNGIVASGEMTSQQRAALLEDMRDEVACLVLANNYRQTQAVSIAEHDARAHQRTSCVDILARSPWRARSAPRVPARRRGPGGTAHRGARAWSGQSWPC
jgi:NAD-specific glutamate dehydrogenase